MNILGDADFDSLVGDLLALQNHGRQGVKFVKFDPDMADTYCGSSHVIPFVSEFECPITRRYGFMLSQISL